METHTATGSPFASLFDYTNLQSVLEELWNRLQKAEGRIQDLGEVEEKATTSAAKSNAIVDQVNTFLRTREDKDTKVANGLNVLSESVSRINRRLTALEKTTNGLTETAGRLDARVRALELREDDMADSVDSLSRQLAELHPKILEFDHAIDEVKVNTRELHALSKSVEGLQKETAEHSEALESLGDRTKEVEYRVESLDRIKVDAVVMDRKADRTYCDNVFRVFDDKISQLAEVSNTNVGVLGRICNTKADKDDIATIKGQLGILLEDESLAMAAGKTHFRCLSCDRLRPSFTGPLSEQLAEETLPQASTPPYLFSEGDETMLVGDDLRIYRGRETKVIRPGSGEPRSEPMDSYSPRPPPLPTSAPTTPLARARRQHTTTLAEDEAALRLARMSSGLPSREKLLRGTR